MGGRSLLSRCLSESASTPLPIRNLAMCGTPVGKKSRTTRSNSSSRDSDSQWGCQRGYMPSSEAGREIFDILGGAQPALTEDFQLVGSPPTRACNPVIRDSVFLDRWGHREKGNMGFSALGVDSIGVGRS